MRRQPRDLAPLFIQRVDRAKRVLYDRTNIGEAAGDRMLRYLSQPARHLVQHVQRLAALIGRLDHPHIAYSQKLPHQAFVANDAYVALNTEFARKTSAQRSQIRQPANRVELLFLTQMISDRDD